MSKRADNSAPASTKDNYVGRHAKSQLEVTAEIREVRNAKGDVTGWAVGRQHSGPDDYTER